MRYERQSMAATRLDCRSAPVSEDAVLRPGGTLTPVEKPWTLPGFLPGDARTRLQPSLRSGFGKLHFRSEVLRLAGRPASFHLRAEGDTHVPYSFQGIGTKYYGHRAQASDGSYITTEWFTLLHFPIIPLGSYRVSPVAGSAKTNFYGVGISSSEQFLVRPAPF